MGKDDAHLKLPEELKLPALNQAIILGGWTVDTSTLPSTKGPSTKEKEQTARADAISISRLFNP